MFQSEHWRQTAPRYEPALRTPEVFVCSDWNIFRTIAALNCFMLGVVFINRNSVVSGSIPTFNHAIGELA
jgi:hypothetical protein